MIDSRDIKELHPTLQRACNELIRRMAEKGYKVGISSTYRDNEKQNELYNKKPRVTTLKGGLSMHNHHLAFDIFQNVKGKEWNDDKFFQTAGKIGQDLGIEWGGSWKSFVDKPHFQWTGPFTQAQIVAGAKPLDTKLKWELSAVPSLSEIKNIVAEARLKNIDHNKAYWDNVITGKEKVNLEWWKILKERVDK